MMFDESDLPTEAATDDALAPSSFSRKNTWLLQPASPSVPGIPGRPVIFIFPKGGHTDWNRVRSKPTIGVPARAHTRIRSGPSDKPSMAFMPG